MSVTFRSPFDFLRKKRFSVSTSFISDDLTDSLFIDRTKQCFKDSTDVNLIVKQHPNLDPDNISDRDISSILSNPELYSEYDSSLDFAQAMEIVSRAKEQFDTLPSALRRRFEEDPYKFLDYVNDEKNYSEMKSFGLLKEKILDTNIPEIGNQPIISDPIKSETQSSSTIEPTA